ncbi:MAG: deoxyuridine 5'-triphosphate nucleotidohydrolase [Bacilli bacterium]|jgi:dUTP pyrophosphatase
MRSFEKISYQQFQKDFSNDVEYDTIKIPKRKTISSAGYDFFLPFNLSIKPNETIKIPTGIKVCLEANEFLSIVVRSSLGIKYNMRMCNQVGIIDADYYNNEENEGHIIAFIKNEGSEIVELEQGKGFVQGILLNYLTVSDEESINDRRNGGFGSTDKEEKNE